MTRTEFLEGLREGLSGEVSSQVVQESVAYYSRYINEAIAEGKTEDQVLEELGPVRLIVKSIIDADRRTGRRDEEPLEPEQNMKQREGFSFRSWYGRLIFILLAVLIVAIVIALVVGIIMAAWYLLPVVVVLGIVIILARIFFGRRQ